MIQTVTVNSALSQNWVECIARTPKAQAARMLRQGQAHAAHWAPCHGAVLWPPSSHVTGRVVAYWASYRAPSCHVAGRVVARTGRVSTPLPRHKTVSRHRGTCRTRCRACRNAPAPYRSPCHALCRNTRPPSRHNTNN